MNDEHLKTLAQPRALLNGAQVVAFSLHSQQTRYDFNLSQSVWFRFHQLSKPDKGLLLSFMAHISGYSRLQSSA